MTATIVPMESSHFKGVIELQELAFPPPFDRDLLWQEEHLNAHTTKFPLGQVVALINDQIVGSCSNTILSTDCFELNLSWKEMVGGYSITTFNPHGELLYGLDISVHPEFRNQGIGRSFYDHRKMLVRNLGFDRYATSCRVPDFQSSACQSVELYCKDIKAELRSDRTLTPLLRYGLTMISVLNDHWDDPESGNAAVRLEWNP